jgi:hypothetical protein
LEPVSSNPPTLFRNPLSFLAYMVTPYTTSEREGLRVTQSLDATGRAYHKLQSTKPQTLGYSLADSPVGLLAWIYEKLVAWTDNYSWTDDEGLSVCVLAACARSDRNFNSVLTWISIYWFSRAGPAASLRIYYEDRPLAKQMNMLFVPVPTGLSFFPGEIYRIPPLRVFPIRVDISYF